MAEWAHIRGIRKRIGQPGEGHTGVHRGALHAAIRVALSEGDSRILFRRNLSVDSTGASHAFETVQLLTAILWLNHGTDCRWVLEVWMLEVCSGWIYEAGDKQMCGQLH